MWIKLPYLCAAVAAMASMVDAFAPSAPLLRSRSNMRNLARPGPAAVRIRAAKDQPDQVIDFGKVGFSDAENQVGHADCLD
eukprot:767109-Hanusia_phi.AAC.11